MKPLYKKVVVIWSESKEQVDLAAREAVEVARSGATKPLQAYGLPAKLVKNPDEDPESDASLEDHFGD